MKLFIGISLPVLILLNIYDFYSTTILLGMGLEEANPFMNWVMGYLGTVPTMLLTKGVFITILCGASYKACNKTLSKREVAFVISAFLLLNTVYGYFMYTRNFQYMLTMN